uniref:Uncharacterized protein n=1 Tax=Meloidogyne enterolobii TaxID=390850 RepID=A0A6V7UBW8_MELEN|nr:unnamed protein product [Meloidogyne enterolobii]
MSPEINQVLLIGFILKKISTRTTNPADIFNFTRKKFKNKPVEKREIFLNLKKISEIYWMIDLTIYLFDNNNSSIAAN